MTRKTEGGKGDRIPGANQAAYEAGYEGIVWNGLPSVHGDALPDGKAHGPGAVQEANPPTLGS